MAKKKEDKIIKNGRPPHFTDPAVMDEKIQKYWRTITRDKPLTQHRYESLSMTVKQVHALPEDKQEELMELVPVLNNDGSPVIETIWIKPPMLLNLQIYLGMSKQSWSDYSLKPEFSDVCTRARHVTEAYLTEETAFRESSTNGLKFLLSAVYGYREVSGVKVETVGKLEDEID